MVAPERVAKDRVVLRCCGSRYYSPAGKPSLFGTHLSPYDKKFLRSYRIRF